MVTLSKVKRNRLNGMPFLLWHEVNIPLRCPPVQVPHKCCYLIPGLALTHQDRDETVPESMVVVQPLEGRVKRGRRVK